MDLKDFEEFMLYKEVIISAQKFVPPGTPEKKFVPPGPQEKIHAYSLFWCFYVMINGEFSYETLPNHNSVTEMGLRINYVSKVRENKAKLKGTKFSTLADLESNLANDHIINLNTFFSLCIIENLNIVYVDKSKKIYLEVFSNPEDMDNLIFVFKDRDYYNFSKNNIYDEIKNNYFHIYKIDKPLKAISSYKVSELVDIYKKVCNRFKIDTSKFIKSDYYDIILVTISK